MSVKQMKSNFFTGGKDALPQVMYADVDPDYTSQRVVVVYPTWLDQRACRPDLDPVPVLVVPIPGARFPLGTAAQKRIQRAYRAFLRALDGKAPRRRQQQPPPDPREEAYLNSGE
jgi:hypothetical protein